MKVERTDVQKRIVSGLALIGLASSLVAVLDLVVIFIVVGRFITPGDLGIATMAMMLFPILDVAGELGLASAVIQHEDDSPENLATVFWLGLAITGVTVGATALLAPAYARLHGQPVVGTMVTVYASRLFLQCVFTVPQALLKKQLRYRELTIVRMVANAGMAATTVGLAWAGFGPWAFVGSRFAHSILTAIGIQICLPYFPRFVFRSREARQYFSFGLKTSGSQLLYHFHSNIDYLVVSAYFGKVALGFYKLAYDLVLEPVRFLATVIIEIAFPAFVRLRGRPQDLTDQFMAFTRMSLVVVLPILAFLLVNIDDVVLAAWGPDWAPVAGATRVLCSVALFRALSFVVPPLVDSLGKPSLTLVYSALAAVVLPASYVAFAATVGRNVGVGFLSVAIAAAVGYPVAFGALVWLALGLTDLSLRAYLRRIVGIMACVTAAFGVSYLVHWALGGLVPVARMALATAALLLVAWQLLARFEKISPRSIVQAIRESRSSAQG